MWSNRTALERDLLPAPLSVIGPAGAVSGQAHPARDDLVEAGDIIASGIARPLTLRLDIGDRLFAGIGKSRSGFVGSLTSERLAISSRSSLLKITQGVLAYVCRWSSVTTRALSGGGSTL
jgi:hypothetical protein